MHVGGEDVLRERKKRGKGALINVGKQCVPACRASATLVKAASTTCCFVFFRAACGLCSDEGVACSQMNG